MKVPQTLKTFLPLVAILIAIGVLMPHAGIFKFEYKKGFPWSYETLTSAFDFPILKTDEEMDAERKAVTMEMIPFYKVDPKVSERMRGNLQSMDLGEYNPYKTALATQISKIFDVGVLPDALDEYFTAADYVYVQKSKRAIKRPCSEIFTVSRAVETLVSDLYPVVGAEADSLVLSADISSLIEPNLVFDEVTSKTFHARSLGDISPTKGIIKAGEVIISKDEIVTEELAQIIDSYKAEYTKSVGYGMHPVLIYLGHFLLALIICVIFYMLLAAVDSSIFQQYNKYLYLMAIFLLSIISIFFCQKSGINPLCFPFVSFALFLCAFFSKKIILPVYLISLIPFLFFFSNGVQIYMIYALAGCVAVYVFPRMGKGYRQFILALVVFAVMCIAHLCHNLVAGEPLVAKEFLMMATSAILTVFVNPLVYLFEHVFSLVSSTRLNDLCDTNNPILKELQTLASGTFQHSIQVMNLSADVAQALDVNVPLVRAGALYHDIGKMVNPQCFIENAPSGKSTYHDNMTCQQSSAALIRHVTDGLVLAKKYHIPSVVADFIATHHGTSTTGYFYTKYLNEGGDPADAPQFSYPGPRPTTKEQVIVCICDSIEAASRTLKSYSADNISDFVERIVRGKMEAGQFDQAKISLEELMIIKARLKKYLEDFYHGRIAYPKSKMQNTRK